MSRVMPVRPKTSSTSSALTLRCAFQTASSGALASQLREFETLRDFFTSATMVTLIDLPFVFLFISIILYVGGPVAFIPLTAVPIVIGVGLILQMPPEAAKRAREPGADT